MNDSANDQTFFISVGYMDADDVKQDGAGIDGECYTVSQIRRGIPDRAIKAFQRAVHNIKGGLLIVRIEPEENIKYPQIDRITLGEVDHDISKGENVLTSIKKHISDYLDKRPVLKALNITIEV